MSSSQAQEHSEGDYIERLAGLGEVHCAQDYVTFTGVACDVWDELVAVVRAAERWVGCDDLDHEASGDCYKCGVEIGLSESLDALKAKVDSL